jgi:DNA polymerase-3 subunit gamma/tau
VESLADYGADYRNFLRELLLHLREILLVKLAPENSPLLRAVLPEERERLGELGETFSEEDLLRGVDVLTRAEGELRQSPDPRVALELALLKLVQMRRLLPFAELVAKVERLSGGAALPPSRSAARVEVPARSASRAPARSAASTRGAAPEAARAVADSDRAGVSRPAPDDPSADPVTEDDVEAPPPSDPAEALLQQMRRLCQTRPTLAQPLRGAGARLDGRTVTLVVAPAFLAIASTHAEEYRELARKAAGRSLAVEFEAAAAAEEPQAAPSDEEVRRQRLREEAEREPAVQEALDLFDGRVVDVKEAKPSGEDA